MFKAADPSQSFDDITASMKVRECCQALRLFWGGGSHPLTGQFSSTTVVERSRIIMKCHSFMREELVGGVMVVFCAGK